jgi:hypothetical protein
MVESLAALASVKGLTASRRAPNGRAVGARAPSKHSNVVAWSHAAHWALLVLGGHKPDAQIEHDVAAVLGANVPEMRAGGKMADKR